RRDRDDDWRYRRNGQYGNVSQLAYNQGYQDGTYTGANDAQRRQNYNPQRSHYYRNGHGDNGNYGGYGGYGGGGKKKPGGGSHQKPQEKHQRGFFWVLKRGRQKDRGETQAA